MPYYGGPPAEETHEIINRLVALNHGGFVTEFSQPARSLDRDGCAQRAAIAGFVFDLSIAAQIEALGLCSDLVVLVMPQTETGGVQLPISIDGQRPFTWLGFHDPDDDRILLDALGPGARFEVEMSTWIAIIDPVWGRPDYLWEQRAITKGVAPFNPVSAHEKSEQ